MTEEYNIYCDESCHLLNDHYKVFVLGAVWVKKSEVEKIFKELRDIKRKHQLSSSFEAKWTKVSESKIDYYKDLVQYFFENETLHFRGLVVPNKEELDHSTFNQDHNTWYYKMFYLLLNVILKSGAKYNLYLDIKDTRSHLKVMELKRILNIASIEEISIIKAQQIRSHEVEIMQITDMLSGALAYKNRDLSKNKGKNILVDFIEESIGKRMLTSTSRTEGKFNILVWKPRK